MSEKPEPAGGGGQGTDPKKGAWTGVIYGCLVAWALNSAIKSKRDRASVQDSRRQHCVQVCAFRRTCFGSGSCACVRGWSVKVLPVKTTHLSVPAPTGMWVALPHMPAFLPSSVPCRFLETSPFAWGTSPLSYLGHSNILGLNAPPCWVAHALSAAPTA